MTEKPEKATTDVADIAALEDLLPDAADIFTWPAEVLDKVIGQCDVVVDTNVLLLPYVAGKESLNTIKQVYANLVAKGRLFVPGRVAREFVKNRPLKIAELLKTVMDQKSLLTSPKSLEFPLLAGLPTIDRVRKAEQQVATAQTEYKTALDSVHDDVLAWGWSDPVTVAYRETFGTTGCIVECALDKEEIEKQRTHRYKRKMPPGYKDAAKDDGGVGDLIIWFTILQLAQTRKKDLLFVTGDEKADWQHRVNSRGFLPRIELVDEYRRASEGRSLFIVPLSELLALMKADARAVETVRKQEAVETVKKHDVVRKSLNLVTVECPGCKATVTCRIGGTIGDSALPTCSQCGERFHVNRIVNGLRTRAPGARRAEAVSEMVGWFEQHYEDPANGVPHESAEGGYQYTNGGPFDALDVLGDQFMGQYPDSWIQEASSRIEEDGSAWVRRGDY
jgi:PIN like domain